MLNPRTAIAATFVLTATIGVAIADEVRFYQKDGVTIQETRRTVERPVVDVRTEEREHTVYRSEVATEMHQTNRAVYVPVTQYHYEQRVYDWWNPFRPAYVAYHLVPRTHWQVRSETIQVPVARQKWIPETRKVKVPVRTLRIETAEKVDRVELPLPLAARPATQANVGRTARQSDRYGGISRLDTDPPRFSTRPGPVAGGAIRR